MGFKKLLFSLIVGISSALTFSLTANAESKHAEISNSFNNTNDSITISFNAHANNDETVKDLYVFVNGEGRQADPKSESFKITSLKEATEYKITLMTVYSNSKTGETRSNLSNEVVFCTCPSETKIISCNTDSQSISLEWEKVSACDGYTIYQKDSTTGKLSNVSHLRGADNTRYTIDNLKRNTSYTYVITTAKFYNGGLCSTSRGVSVTEKTLDHPEAPTSRAKPGLLRIKGDTRTIPDENGNYVVIRRGIYTGYRADDNTYMVSCAYGDSPIPYSDDNVDVIAVSSNANSILSTGSISQLGQGVSHPNGCGPTAAAILIAHELFIPNGDATVSKNTIINDYRYDSRVGKFSYGQYWCVSSGTYMNNGVKVIVNDYAKKYGKKAVYYDPAFIVGNTFAERQNKLIDKIDSELAAGHRIIACVRHVSNNSSGVTQHNYLGAYTHYVVICAETGGRNGKYYIADPFYSEKTPYAINNGVYYYGLEERSKAEMSQSIMYVGDYLIRGIVFIS